jgi:gas vesicle protein
VISRKQARKDTAKTVAIGTVVAAAAGYIAGVLTAPKTGKQTRKDIKDAADKSFNQAEKELKKLHTDLGASIEKVKGSGDKTTTKAKKEISNLLELATEAKEKARIVLSAAHEGDADDKDLKKAIKDANTAIGHLKEFIKK